MLAMAGGVDAIEGHLSPIKALLTVCVCNSFCGQVCNVVRIRKTYCEVCKESSKATIQPQEILTIICMSFQLL